MDQQDCIKDINEEEDDSRFIEEVSGFLKD